MLPATYLQKLIVCGATLIACVATAFSQQTSGAIKGAVTDQLGALVINAEVTARDRSGKERTTTSNTDGNYELKALPAGNYDVRVVAAGFNVFEQKNIEVKPSKTTALDFQLAIGALEQTVTVDNKKGISTDSDRNADSVVLSGRDLEALPNDPDALLATLQAMSGPVQGENGGGAAVKVDGFSNGQMPPKEAIREVRINNNPYSAENEYMGWNGIEIFTQPGSEKWHGNLGFNFADESLNSRNPYAFRRAPFQQRVFNGALSGPIVKKRASFNLYAGRNASETNSVVNATTLDLVTLRPFLFNQTFVPPQRSEYVSARLDLKLNKKHTLVGSYDFNEGAQGLQGIGGFSLPSRAFSSRRQNHNVQLVETALINEKAVNEMRFQFSHSIFRQTANTTLPALNVIDSVFDGGAQIGTASNRQDRADLQNFTSWQAGKHFIKVGERLRYVRIRSISPGNFGGTYTFAGGLGPVLDANDKVVPGGDIIQISSLEQYRRTLSFQRQKLPAAEIRSLGGGATQFSIAGGNPEARVTQADISVYVQDEWKLRPNLTISPGLRYENQDNIRSKFNVAPRISFAWSPNFGGGKKTEQPPAKAAAPAATPAAAGAAAAKPKPPAQPKIVIRGGFGIFYNRISEDLSLQARRFNGFNQQQFVVTDPSVLDLFPAIPAVTLLTAFAQPQTRRELAAALTPSQAFRSSFSVERLLPHKVKLTFTYFHTHTLHTTRTVNINAPLEGTGVRPLGQSEGNILQSQSTGRSRVDQLNISIQGTIKKINFWSGYNLTSAKNTDGGTSGSPFDPYDFSHEFARNPNVAKHFFYGGGYYQTKSGFSINMFMIATSGTPFNITTGRDTNGDTFFSERPAFATDLTKPGVIVTPYGALDPNPVPGQTIIPRNLGNGPHFASVNIGMEKAFMFGRAIPPRAAAASAGGNVVSAAGEQKPPPKQPIQRPYSLRLSVYISNILNHTNKGNPVGNMASPFFLQSTGTNTSFIFGPGGGGNGGNRLMTVRLRLGF
jgi:carboxypeptidase family protein/TonB-dependent receptor-like protein